MNIVDYQNVSKHINILNVAYHTNIEITKKSGDEYKAICPFCGYRDNKRESNLSLNYINNKYHCFKCGQSGYSIGLYAKLNYIDNKQAFKELLSKEFFSIDRSKIKITPINEITDINYRNEVYSEFLNMLKLDIKHKKYLKEFGFTESSIINCNFKSIPSKPITRKIICSNLRRKYNLEGIPGFYMHEDFTWDFSSPNGFFIPVYDEERRIKGLSIHLDKKFNNCKNVWFSSNNKINGTQAKNWTTQSNIIETTETVILTDDLLTYSLVKEITDKPIIAFSNITNSYSVLNELENTNIKNIIFTIREEKENQKLDYIIERIFKDLLYKGYDISYKFINNCMDLFKDNFLERQNITMKKVA